MISTKKPGYSREPESFRDIKERLKKFSHYSDALSKFLLSVCDKKEIGVVGKKKGSGEKATIEAGHQYFASFKRQWPKLLETASEHHLEEIEG